MSLRATASLTVVLVDDERLAREELEFLLRDFIDVEVVGVAENGVQALEVIETIDPDVVFLDVQMPGLDGLDLIRRIQERKVRLPFFVLATAYDQYALEAFRLEAMDYLLKPIEKDRLGLTIERAKRYVAGSGVGDGEEEAGPARVGSPKSKVVVKAGSRNLLVDTSEVVYAKIEDGLIRIVASGVSGESSYKTIDELQGDLDPEVFWRVHRGYLVNLNRIREVNPWFHSSLMLKMDDEKGTEVPVSRAQAKKLRAFLKL
ncbi:MAG: LytR/AlgR family response regulator transcription factor [Acidobacteriota bacterium]